MAGYIPEHTIAQVQAATDIVGLISQYVPLKKAGRNYTGLCPFHKEKTPSFSVSPEKQIFYCFGCKEGGSPIHFLMLLEHMTFPEAIRYLAKNNGITIPEESSSTAKKRAQATSERESIYSALESTVEFFVSNLQSDAGADAQRYLKDRKIGPETAKQWNLGFSLQSWDSLCHFMKSRQFPSSTLEKAGLINKRGEGEGHYDRFRGRLMFPITDVRDRFIGFGARYLEKQEGPKYLNSPETPTFDKSSCLYGINRAKSAFGEKKAAIIVEGYTDVLMAHQHGIHHVVATLGTSLTKQHINLLRRYVPHVVLVYDADLAGEKASDRSIDLFLQEDLNVSVATLEEGLDPCDFILKYGPRAFEDQIDRAKDILAFKLQRARSKYDFDRINDKAQATDEILSLVPKISNEVKKNLFLQEASSELKIPEQTLRARVSALSHKSRYTPENSVIAKKSSFSAAHIAQRDIVSYLLKFPKESQDLFFKVSPEEFLDEDYRTIYQVIRDLHETEGHFEPNLVIGILETRCNNSSSSRLATEILAKEKDGDLLVRVQGSLNWFTKQRKKQDVLELKEKMKEAQTRGDSKLAHQLLKQIQKRLATTSSSRN